MIITEITTEAGDSLITESSDLILIIELTNLIRVNVSQAVPLQKARTLVDLNAKTLRSLAKSYTLEPLP